MGPLLRAEIFHHAVPVGKAWRHHCPRCHTQIIRRALAGVLAPLPITGRCPHCHGAIGPHAGAVELIAASTLTLIGSRLTQPLSLLACCCMALFGVALAFIDMRVHRLPDRLILTALLVTTGSLALEAALHDQWSRLGIAGLCAIASAATYLLLVFTPHGFGAGDLKLAAVVGTATGWFGVETALLAGVGAFILSGVAAVIVALARRSLHGSIPHGPSMLITALAAVLITA